MLIFDVCCVVFGHDDTGRAPVGGEVDGAGVARDQRDGVSRGCEGEVIRDPVFRPDEAPPQARLVHLQKD